MRNADGHQEFAQAPPTRRCAYCGDFLLSQRRGARFCSREHKELARAARRRAGERLTRLRGNHPFAGSPDLREFGDEIDLTGFDEHQDDEAGIVAGDSPPDPWQQRNDDFAAQAEFAMALETVNADIDRRARSHVERQRRNPGTVLPELAALERERTARLGELTREHQLAAAYRMAKRDRPGRIISAHERQAERAAARALGRDLPGGSRRYQAPAWTGRDTGDIATW